MAECPHRYAASSRPCFFTSAGTSDYVLYSFRLTDARTSRIVWEDSAEVKKQGLEDAAYR